MDKKVKLSSSQNMTEKKTASGRKPMSNALKAIAQLAENGKAAPNKEHGIKEPKEYEKGLWSVSATNRFRQKVERDMAQLLELNCLDKLHVYLADGNKKTGSEVPSISLMPEFDCGNNAMCRCGCYDIHHDVIHDGCYQFRLVNSAIARYDMQRFFSEVEERTRFIRTLRFHIGGDFLSFEYFDKVVELATKRPDMKILAFTKMFDIVNNWLEAHDGVLPENLHVMFSLWPGVVVPNPYNIPTCTIVLPNGKSFNESGNHTLDPVDHLCNGNCTVCNNDKKGCWVAKRGQRIGINFHG